MEDGINPDRKKQSQPFRWLQEIDQILVVGMKYGPKGTQEAVKRVRQLTPELVPVQVWHRMRHLREKERGKSATPVDWSEPAIEILRNGYRSGGRKKTEAIKTYLQHFELVIKSGDVPGAFRVLERVRGRTLAWALEDRKAFPPAESGQTV